MDSMRKKKCGSRIEIFSIRINPLASPFARYERDRLLLNKIDSLIFEIGTFRNGLYGVNELASSKDH